MIWELTDTNGRKQILKGDFAEATEHAIAFYIRSPHAWKNNRDLVALFPLDQVKSVMLEIAD